MGLLGAILGIIGAVSAALGVVSILEVTTEPIINEHFTWGFWFALAVVLFLAAITLLVGRSPSQGKD